MVGPTLVEADQRPMKRLGLRLPQQPSLQEGQVQRHWEVLRLRLLAPAKSLVGLVPAQARC